MSENEGFSTNFIRTATWIGDRGWPYLFERSYYPVDHYVSSPFVASKYDVQNPPRFDASRLDHQTWRTAPLAWDAVIAVACVATTALLTETLARRRGARRR